MDKKKAIKNTLQKAKDETIEQIIERKGGWKPGMRTKFDKALMENDKEGVKSMLGKIPAEYEKRFENRIKEIIK